MSVEYRTPPAAELQSEPVTAPRWLLATLRGFAILLGMAGAAAGALNESMNSDGISYLDIGDAYFAGEWWTAVNATWSPLYPLILGAVLKVIGPGVTAEFAVVHAVGFGLFLLALVCFEFFMREARRRYYAVAGEKGAVQRLPDWAFTSASYGLFIWSSTALIPVWAVTPDMLVAACLYLSAGLLLRAGAPEGSRRTFAALGVCLGLGYLAKAAMFPMAFVFLALGAMQARRRFGTARSVAPALGAFLVISLPFIGILSVKAGHPTFSDVGWFTFLKHVYRVPVPHFEPGVAPVSGELLHPLTKVETSPPVYGFAEPIGGTYPLAYDPAFWYQGLEAPFDARLQALAIAESLQYYFDLFFRLQGPLLGVVLLSLSVAFAAGRRPWSADGWQLVVIACAAFGMYALVYVTGRYIGGFVVLFWTGALMLVQMPPGAASRVWMRWAGAAMTFALAVNIFTFHLDGLNAMLGWVASPPGMVSASPPPPARPSVIARHLTELGLRPGDPVGVIGYSFDAFWARLARVRIVAEISPREVDAFWSKSDDRQAQVIEAFARLGVRAVVAEQVPRDVALPGAVRLGNTSYYVFLPAR
jgi:hypothetical protein